MGKGARNRRLRRERQAAKLKGDVKERAEAMGLVLPNSGLVVAEVDKEKMGVPDGRNLGR